MSVYVLGYAKRPEESRPLPSVIDNVEVQYSNQPDWIMQFVWEAESECFTLNKMGVHVGEHCCVFSVEELPRGGFVVVCRSHPEVLQVFEIGDTVREHGSQDNRVITGTNGEFFVTQISNDAATVKYIKAADLELTAKAQRPNTEPGFVPGRSIMDVGY